MDVDGVQVGVDARRRVLEQQQASVGLDGVIGEGRQRRIVQDHARLVAVARNDIHLLAVGHAAQVELEGA